MIWYRTVSPSVHIGRNSFFPFIWGFFFSSRSQFVLYLSGISCWIKEILAGLSPDFWTDSSVSFVYVIFVLFCISVFKRRGGFHLFLNKALWSAFFRSGLIIIYCNNIWPEYLLGSPQGIYAELSWDLVYITLYLKQKLLTVTLALLINKGAVCGHLYHGCGPNTL